MRSNFKLFSHDTESALPLALRQHLRPVGEEIDQWLTQRGEMASSLAEVSQRGLLREYLAKSTRTSLSKTGEMKFTTNTPLLKLGDIDDKYPHFSILMAIAHEGGNIFDIEKTEASELGLDIYSLIDRLRLISPQQFISTSGLLPGPKSNQMYRDLLKNVLSVHGKILIHRLNSDPLSSYVHSAHWLQTVETLTGQPTPENPFLINVLPDSRLALNTRKEAFDFTHYQRLMEIMCPGENQFGHDNLDRLFYPDAFAMLETCQNKVETIKVITAKARYWADKTNEPQEIKENLVEQLLASALIAHPEHFKFAGCGIRNLTGLVGEPTGSKSSAPMKRELLAGPLATFSRSRIKTQSVFGLSPLSSFLQGLEPSFSIETLIERRGFAHPRLIELVESLGGHHPAIEAALTEGSIPNDQVSPVLQMVKRKKAYGAYQLDSLVALLRPVINKLQRFAPVNPDDESAQAPETPKNSKSQTQWDRGEYFLPAFAQRPGLKAAVITYLETLEGVTPDHLMLIGVNGADVPQIVKKMPLKAQGALFSADLGL
ncbi:hypothetical protein V0M98_34530 (plasmid) [Pseudomonas silesiensis]|uniref:hypothetical protein n=1 Tax=Pseudomonas silesiensis TaxID=1853130 RepID=UPI0030CEC863